MGITRYQWFNWIYYTYNFIYVIKWAVKNGINESVLNYSIKSNNHYNN